MRLPRSMLIGVFSVALVIVLLAPQSADACSAILLNKTGRGPNAITAFARTMDFDSDLETTAVWLPRKSVIPFTPVCQPDCSFTPFELKYGFVGMMVYSSFALQVCLSLRFADCGLTMTEGLNEEGLGVSLLWDATVSSYPEYEGTEDMQPRTAVAVSDLTAYLLGSFRTVAEVRKALDVSDGGVQVVGLNLPEQLAVLMEEVIGSDFINLHLSVVDAAGGSIVIEFRPPRFTATVFDNPAGVLTNEPQLPQQYLFLEQLRSSQQGTPGGEAVFTIPGDYSSTSRFQRLALLNEATVTGKYSPNATYGPSVGHTIGKSQLVEVLNIITKMELPLGLNDAGQLGSTEVPDQTQWTVLRDHTNLAMYYKSPADPTFRSLRIGALKRRRAKGMLLLPINAKAKTWFTDESAGMLSFRDAIGGLRKLKL